MAATGGNEQPFGEQSIHPYPVHAHKTAGRYHGWSTVGERLYKDTQNTLRRAVRNILEQVLLLDGCDRFAGQVEEVGSYANESGSSGSDFDYLLVLKTCLTKPADIRRETSPEAHTRNLTGEERSEHKNSYFQITFGNSPPDMWQTLMTCVTCRDSNSKCIENHRNRFLDANGIQELFLRLIVRASRKCILPSDFTITGVARLGPAVSILFTHKGIDEKVNITLAFALPQLHADVCRLMPGGDCWKLSLPLAEHRHQQTGDRHIPVTSELLRHHCPDDAPLVPGKCTNSTVVHMVQGSTASGKESASIEDDLINTNDHSDFPEAYRILDHLRKLRRTCYKEGVIHTLLWTLIVFLISSIFVGVIYMASLSHHRDCLVFSRMFGIDVSMSEDAVSIIQAVKKSEFYGSLSDHAADDMIPAEISIFSLGFPWQIPLIDSDSTNISHFTKTCHVNLTFEKWNTTCLVSHHLIISRRNVFICRKAFLILTVVCTYVITFLCLVGTYRSKSGCDQRTALYEVNKSLRVMYVVVLRIIHVFMGLVSVSHLQYPLYNIVKLIQQDPLLIIVGVALLPCGISIVFPLCYILEKKNARKLTYGCVVCFSLLQYIQLIIHTDEMKDIHIRTAGLGDITQMILCSFNLCCSVWFLSHSSLTVGGVVVVVYLAIIMIPVSLTILLISGLIVLFAVLHICQSRTKVGERRGKYKPGTIQNQYRRCFQNVFSWPMLMYICGYRINRKSYNNFVVMALFILALITLYAVLAIVFIYIIYVESRAIPKVVEMIKSCMNSKIYSDMSSNLWLTCKESYLVCPFSALVVVVLFAVVFLCHLYMLFLPVFCILMMVGADVLYIGCVLYFSRYAFPMWRKYRAWWYQSFTKKRIVSYLWTFDHKDI